MMITSMLFFFVPFCVHSVKMLSESWVKVNTSSIPPRYWYRTKLGRNEKDAFLIVFLCSQKELYFYSSCSSPRFGFCLPHRSEIFYEVAVDLVQGLGWALRLAEPSWYFSRKINSRRNFVIKYRLHEDSTCFSSYQTLHNRMNRHCHRTPFV